jgi:ribonuclease PH
MSRHDGRAASDLRQVSIEPGFVRTADGSALIAAGKTRVICTASVEEKVPRWMQNKGRGWVTAEYSMLPASTGQRKQRDVSKGRPDGRTVEIQRLIGRSLRGVVDFEALGERTVWIDCDVLEADGGTRCAAITGGYVALELALKPLVAEGVLEAMPLNQSVAAVSCGVVDGTPVLDLDYPEDSNAEVDMNVVMTGDDGLVEVQATGERTPLSRTFLDDLLALAAGGIAELREHQRAATGSGREERSRASAGEHRTDGLSA